MSQAVFKVLINIPVIIITFMLGFYLPELSPRNVLFGIKISSEEGTSPVIAEIIQQYKRLYLLVCGSFSAVFMIFFYFNGKYYLLLAGLILLIILMEVVQNIIYKKAKRLDIFRNSNKTNENYFIIDNRPQKNQYFSQNWFIIPGAFIVFSILCGAAIYQTVPNFLPSGLFYDGSDIHFIRKSVWLLAVPAVLQVFTLAIAYILFTVISRLQLSTDKINTEVAEQKNIQFRCLWSVVVLAVCIFMDIFLFLMELRLLVRISSKLFLILTVLILFIIASILVAALKFASTDRASAIINSIVNLQQRPLSSSLIDRTDDSYRILGSYYFNRHDPEPWIKTRTGLGLDFNFARPLVWLIFSIPITFFLVIFIYLFINKI